MASEPMFCFFKKGFVPSLDPWITLMDAEALFWGIRALHQPQWNWVEEILITILKRGRSCELPGYVAD